MADTQENVLTVPIESFRKITGFALDIGGSVCKVVYRHKDDWEALEKTKLVPKTGTLRIALCRSEDTEEVCRLLKEKCHISRAVDDPTPTVYTTGVGSNLQGDLIQKLLDVKIQNQSELDCFVDGFIYMSQNFSREQFLIPLNTDVVHRTYKVVKEKIDAFKLLASPNKLKDSHTVTPEGGIRYDLPRPLANSVEFPILLVVCGSATLAAQVESNGQYAIVDNAVNGGRAFLGMASLLTGAKTYDEIIDLASKGDNGNLDLYPRDLVQTDSEDGYSKAISVQDRAMGDIIFHFQKAIGKKLEDFKPEDVALSLLHMFSQQLAQLVLYSAMRSKTRHAFFCGSFFNRSLVRDVMTDSLLNRMIFVDSLENGLDVDLGFHFIRNGSHLGAIGALVSPLVPRPDPEKTK